MYGDLDEFPTHQIVAPHGRVVAENPSWTDRYYFSTFAPDGGLILEMGIGAFPNADVLEGFACASVRNGDQRVQHNLRPSRPLGGKLLPLTAGPLSFEILEPQRRWRIRLADNAQDFSYDLNLTWEGRPFEADPIFFKDKKGNVITHVCHYVQRGRTSGVARIGGHEYRLDGAVAFRDRSWGIRSTGEGGPSRGMLNWVPISVGDDLIIYYLLEREDGTVTYLSGARLSVLSGEEERIASVKHDVNFESGSKIFKNGRIALKFDSGRDLEFSMRKLGSLYLKGGGYHQGGHGIARGAEHVEGERWDISTVPQQQEVSVLNDNISEFTFSDGRVGSGIYEIAIGRYPRYGFES